MVLIGVIVFVTGIISYIVSNMLFSTSGKGRQQEVEEVKPITAEFKQPDKQYFNPTSINPTKQITIGENPNPQPFKSAQ